MVRADLDGPAALSGLLRARVPSSWPPELLLDARAFFAGQLSDNPARVGWLLWYWVAQDAESQGRVLVGNGGFMGLPDGAGDVEIGYSVEPAHQGQGFATEAVRALTQWAFASPAVRRVFADVSPLNAASLRVLQKTGFHVAGAGATPDLARWELLRQSETP